MIGLRERFGPDVGARCDTLANSGAVANQKKMNLATRPPVVKPTLKRDFLANVAAQVLDVHPRHEFAPCRWLALLAIAVTPSGSRLPSLSWQSSIAPVRISPRELSRLRPVLARQG